MKTLYFLILIIFTVTNVHSQTCTRIVDYEDFSNSQGFTSVGPGNVTIAGGKAQWVAAMCSFYDKKYRNLNDTLSNNYFKASFDFTVLPNPPGNGTGAVLLAFTAGTEDFLTYDSIGGYLYTNQDGIGITIISSTTTNHNINNWFVTLYTKKDSTRTIGINTIALSSAITNYYLIFERQSDSIINMSLYTDSLLTTLLGQASNIINPDIQDLFVLQFGTVTTGWHTRQFNGSMDNVLICDNLSTVGIPENNLQSLINVSGNLISKNGFSVRSLYNGEIELSLFDLTGKQVEQKTISPGDNHIDSNFPSGMYLLVFRTGDGNSLQQKLIVD